MDRSVTGLDHRSLAAFRIAFGATLLGNLWARAHDGNFVAHYSEIGVFPMEVTRDMAFGLRWSVFDAIGTETAASFAVAAILVVYLAYTFGLFTRLSQVLVAAILVMLYHRNPLVDDGSDSAMRLFAVWTAFLPLGERFSLDVIWRRKRPTTGHYTGIAVWLLIINLAISYFLNAIQKDAGRWGVGLAIRDVLWDPWIAGPLAVWGRTHLPDLAIRTMTWGTLVVEYTLMATVMLVPFSVWARRITIVLMLALHGGIALFMNLGSFSFIFLSLPLLFVPSRDWDRLPIARVGTRRRERLEVRLLVGALALFWASYCAVFLAMNFRMPKPVRATGAWARGPFIVAMHEAFMIPQNWLKFRNPSQSPWTLVVQVEERDGTVRDFLRPVPEGTPFNLYLPLEQSAHMGKYWVSWMLYMTFPQYQAYREPFAEYLYRQGAERFWVHQVTVQVPDGPSAEPKGKSSQLLFWGERPKVLDLGHRSVTAASGRYMTQAMRQFGRAWTGDNQLFFTFDQAGESAELTLRSPRACPARVTIASTRAPDYGRARLTFPDGGSIEIDGYSPLGVNRHETTLATELFDGSLRIDLDVVGKADASEGYKIGLDSLTVRCLDAPPPPRMPAEPEASPPPSEPRRGKR